MGVPAWIWRPPACAAAAEYGARALATISDHVTTVARTSAEERETTFDEMMHVGLEALLAEKVWPPSIAASPSGARIDRNPAVPSVGVRSRAALSGRRAGRAPR